MGDEHNARLRPIAVGVLYIVLCRRSDVATIVSEVMKRYTETKSIVHLKNETINMLP